MKMRWKIDIKKFDNSDEKKKIWIEEIADNLIYDYEIIHKETQLASKFEIRKSETFVKYQNFMRNSFYTKRNVKVYWNQIFIIIILWIY